VPPDRPDQIVLVTNFGLIFSEDGGESWLFSCERGLNAYAGPYALGARPSKRIFGMTSGAGLIYSDDDSCSWQAAGGTDVIPYAFSVDPSSSQRVYVIGVPLDDFRAGESIHISNDGGLTLGAPVFTAPGRSALLTVLAAPGRPSTLFATMFSVPESHPVLLRSSDSGEHWEIVVDLVDSLGENPFELLAIDAVDERRLYVKILESSAESLAISADGGLSFAKVVSLPGGELDAFLKLESGTILVGGTAGTEAVAYRSTDAGQSFQPWAEAPHVHALAERNGKLYVGTDNFLDGYAIAESDDEGAHLRPLTGFERVRAVKSCVADGCAERCAYYAAINLWPEAVCTAESGPLDADDDVAAEPVGPGSVDSEERSVVPALGGDSACGVVRAQRSNVWATLALGAMLIARRRARRTRAGA
jgi:hypothetical protein